MPIHTDHPVFPHSHDLVERVAAHRPAAATIWGVPGHDHEWDDISPDAIAEWDAFLATEERTLDALPETNEEWGALAVDVARTWLGFERGLVDQGYWERALGHVASPLQGFHLTLSHMEKATPEHREAIQARLYGLPEALARYRQGLAAGLASGNTVAARQVRSCMKQCDNVVDNRLLDVFEGADTNSAHAAYAELGAWLASDYLPAAPETDGVGEDRYRPAAEGFLHTPLDVDGTYAWGWERVTELHHELTTLLDRVAPGRALAETVEAWRTDPATSAEDPEAFLDRVRGWQSDALAALDTVFPVPDVARDLRIERAPVGLPPGAWYLRTTEDAGRTAVVQYSLRDGRVPLFDQQSTAVHEGFPGHHLQLSIQTTLADRLSRVQRVPFHCIGFSEGWALYAERVVDEHGLYDDDIQRLGYLVNQIARACRVVVDIGLHTSRAMPDADLPTHGPTGTPTGFEPGSHWDFDRAVAFMTEIGGLRREVSASEVTRYLGWPGQAISYMVGQKLLLDLRGRFVDRGHSVREFHERVLGMGTVGLSQVAGALEL